MGGSSCMGRFERPCWQPSLQNLLRDIYNKICLNIFWAAHGKNKKINQSIQKGTATKVTIIQFRDNGGFVQGDESRDAMK